MEKDLSKLRPFNPEEAKAGGLMCDVSRVGGVYTYIAGPDAGGWIATENEKGIFIFSVQTNLFMLPLCWVEGNPVYPGDALEVVMAAGDPVCFVAGYVDEDKCLVATNRNHFIPIADGNAHPCIRWPRPKPVKRWINIYPANSFESQGAANEYAMSSRIACIEIELPPPPTEVKP